MYQAAAIALGTLSGVYLLIAIVQSWRFYCRAQTESRDLENGLANRGDRADIHGDDIWIFGSVASRSTSHCPRRGSYVRVMSESSDASSVQAMSPANPTTRVAPKTRATMPEGGRNDGTHLHAWTQEHTAALPSPARVYQAQPIRFQHASLVPIPLRPRQGMASQVAGARRESRRSESVEVDIRPTPDGHFLLHPHPLRSHPVSIGIPAQAGQLEGRQKETAGIQQRSLTITDSQVMRAAVQSGLCRPDSTTLGVEQPDPCTSAAWYREAQEKKSDGVRNRPQDIVSGQFQACGQQRMLIGTAL